MQITGTGNGIGKQLALQLCEVAPKSILICLDNEENANEETVQKIRQKNVQVFGFCIDISNRELVSSLARKVRSFAVEGFVKNFFSKHA